jgi:acetylornithine/N-succinyldiaminopimelate aminotransferase
VPFDDVEAAARAITPETAAILVEPIQGEGGIRSFPTQSLKRLRELCDKHGLLLIYDEVQCGVGRTGKLFAYEWSGVEPDLMAIAKGIGGGFPMGACLATDAAAVGMTAGVHGTTFGGNPLAMAVGNAVLDVVLEDGFLDAVGHKGLLMKQGLAAIADEFPEIVEDIRGIGLMLGLKCVAPNTRVSGALRDQKVLSVPAGDNVVRLLPPLVISEDEIRIGLERIRNGVRSLARATATASV